MSRLHACASASASASASALFTPEQLHQRSSSKYGRHMLHFPPYPHLNLQRIKAKRVTEPLNDAVRSKLRGNWTDVALNMETATAQPDYGDHRIDSSALTDMRFLEEEEKDGGSDCSRPDFPQNCGSDGESSSDRHAIQLLGEQLCQILEGVCTCNTKLETMLLRDIKKTQGMAAERAGPSYLRRFIMNSLRCAGYNAAICKSRWEQTNGYPAGDYEFIDVVVVVGMGVEASCSSNVNNNTDRLLVDIDFRAQFEIARPTAQYAALTEVLPTLFVGSADKLGYIIRIMCDAAKRSLKANGMHLPPWRKYRYVESKWLGPYQRTSTSNAIASTPADKDERLLLVKGLGGIASSTGMGYQMELHFEKAVKEANKAAQEKLKIQRQEEQQKQQIFNDLRFAENGEKYRESGKRVSALTAALAEPATYREH